MPLALYVRAFARNQNGETLSDIKRLNPPPIVAMVIPCNCSGYRLVAVRLVWYFPSLPEKLGLSFTIGWVYIPDTDEQGIWIWSPEHNWLWTQKGFTLIFTKINWETGFTFSNSRLREKTFSTTNPVCLNR